VKKLTTTEADIVRFGQDIQVKLRLRMLETIEAMLEEELADPLGSEAYERSEGRRGYRNGAERRVVTAELGTREIRVPEGRLNRQDGTTDEFPERGPAPLRPPHQAHRRGDPGHRPRRRQQPARPKGPRTALGPEHLSRRAVLRVVARLEGLFESWDQRDLSAERYSILFLDGLNLEVCLARRVVSVPVLAVLGVAEDGTKVLVSLRLAASEATSHCAGILIDPERRGLTGLLLLVVVGHAGLRKALEAWPGV
jgi:transposase-like protein